ncbi:kinase-like domain-containing protein [Emericellopsis atlantica]|uniref:non-specific serine/threonine protein kinase n=1 Tax=Emericellopsis atlantica TaxID=2614577 RepID=A0A9P8CP02_9HYPO|nr:kinase-like domain-containing protein [Emericellopsis atlantica]KAG9253677.1 kinase-like domain-containing protein [Emericellopsis atlantica]
MLSRNFRTAYSHVPPIFYSLRASARSRCPTVILTRTTPAASSTLTSEASPDRVEYEWTEGIEDLEEYCPGGYHPVSIGNVLHNRYEIIDKLGYGGYSTTWLARDRYHQKYVAVKVGISDAPLHQRNESRILQRLSHPRIPKILDHFDVTGPNGTHPCYTMAVAQGNLNDALCKPMFPVEVGRVLAAKLASAVAYIHSQGYVHGG